MTTDRSSLTTRPSRHNLTTPVYRRGERVFNMTTTAAQYIGACLIFGYVLHLAMEAAR